MRKKYLIGLLAVLTAATALFACGGGGGDGADPNALATVTLTPSKQVALADGADAVTIQANVRTVSGGAAPNGTVVTFSAPGGGGLSATTAGTVNGIATVNLTHALITGANNATVVVSAAAGGKSGTVAVKFINAPSSAVVSIALTKAVDNLAGLRFTLNNTPGATFNFVIQPQPISAVNTAAGSTVTGASTAVPNSNAIVLTNTAGFVPGTLITIIEATYQVAVVPGEGLPRFSVDTAALFQATNPVGNPTIPNLTPADLLVTVKFNTE